MAKRSILSPISERAPCHLSPEAKEWFNSVIRDYSLDHGGLALLRTCAEAWDRMQSARKILATKGLTYSDKFSNPRARPECKIENDSRITFMKALRQLNLDPDISPPGPPSLAHRGRR